MCHTPPLYDSIVFFEPTDVRLMTFPFFNGNVYIRTIGSVNEDESRQLNPTKTFVFYNLKTTGLLNVWNIPRNDLRGVTSQQIIKEEYEKMIHNVPQSAYPCITEVTVSAISREDFMSKKYSMFSMPKKNFTQTVNPDIDEAKWKEYERNQKKRPYCYSYTKPHLLSKCRFGQLWEEKIIPFLESLPKPICLISHGGLYFDQLILHRELTRYGLLHTIPQETFFIDSMLAAKHIESSIVSSLNNFLNGCPWPYYRRKELFASLPFRTWPLLFKLRANPDFLEITRLNGWQFNAPLAFSLQELFSWVKGRNNFNFRHAIHDVLALIAVSLAYEGPFIQYIDAAAVELRPSEPPVPDIHF